VPQPEAAILIMTLCQSSRLIVGCGIGRQPKLSRQPRLKNF